MVKVLDCHPFLLRSPAKSGQFRGLFPFSFLFSSISKGTGIRGYWELNNLTPDFVMYTAEGLKQQFGKLSVAKAEFGLKARGWQALADKLNQPSGEDATKQLEQLRQENAALKQELAALKAQVGNSDPVGFWLLDGNFDRSRFSDFGVPDAAFKKESVAKQFHKELSRRYHPDKGGTPEQMANLNKLLDQILALVEMNYGVGV
jgi:hypothetical protein